MKRVKIGDSYILADDNEMNSGDSHEVTIDDLDLSRNDYLEYKRSVYRRGDYENMPKHKERSLYSRVKQHALRKGVPFPLEREEFLDKLYNVPVLEEDGKLRPFPTIALEGRGITRISPVSEGIELYYNNTNITTIVYNI